MLATAFLSACSCSGDKTDNLPQVPVNTISITSDYEGAVRDEETGFLNIDCIYGDEFNITYKLGPDNTTRTQVDWDFDGRDDVVASKRNYYTYSQGTTHTISFVTKSAGETIIKFKPRGTDKWTQANIKVSTPKSSWPTFVAPTGLDYNPTTGKVTWNPVEKMTVGSTIVNVEKNNGQILGLTGYLVNYKNLTTGEEYSTPSNQPIAQCEFELPRGYTYMINVSAKGNNFSHNDSPASENFKFHQLASATELSNDSGKISFKTPAFADTNEVYYNKNTSSNIKISSSGEETYTFYANQKFSSLNEYNVYVISYPKDYALAKQEGKNYVLDESGIRYYPSVQTNTLTIQNLVAPTISMTPVQGIQEIKMPGTTTTLTFGEKEINVNNPYISSQLNWEISGKTYSQEYGVKYSYAIYKGDTKILPSGDGYITTNGSKEKEDTSLDLGILRTNPGSYRIEIFACGNSTNTIPSQKTELAFTVLNAMDTTTTINEKEILQTNIANSNLFGVELYFINKTNGTFNPEKSVYKFFDAKNSVTNAYDRKQLFIDISDGKLKLEPGTYDIYGRFVGINNGTYNLSVTSDVAKINTKNVVIASPVKSATLSSQGVLTFEKVYDYTDYILDFTHNKNGKTINFSKVITPADYDLNEHDNKTYINLDIYKIFSEYLSNGHSTEQVGEFTSDCQIAFTIKTVGKEDGVNSKATNSIEFSRRKMIDLGSVKLDNYILTFKAPDENNSLYKISIGGYVYTTSERKKGETTIDLRTAVIDEDKTEQEQRKLADLVNTSSSTEIKIWACGDQANTNSSGSLDSFAQTQSFECTEVPTDLEMKELEMNEGVKLLWNLSNDFETAQIFTLRFYTQNDSGAWELAKTLELNGGVERLTSEEEGVLGKYSYNIAGAIEELNSDTPIAITVQHIMSTRFTNEESEKYYTIKLSSVELSYAMSDGNPAIGFTTLNTSGLTYTLSITKDGGTPNTLTYTELTSDTLCTKTIKDDLAITEKGNYVLSLYASSTPTGTNTETNPFVLSSTSNTLTINIISSQIQAYADGEFVKWNAIHDDATYKLAYKVNGSSDYVEVAETFTKDNCKYNVWSILASGTNQVKVTPSIDYETTGCILSADEVLVCDIVKLDTVSSISTSNGKLTYTLSEDSLVDYSLYVYAGSTKLSSDSYIIDYANKEITILSSALVGEKAYALQIVQKEKVNAETGEVLITGKINSDISSAYNATKIEAVSDLSKIGEWIQFTPVANAEIYELTFKMVGGSDVVSKQIKFDGTKVYIANIGEDNSITWTEDVNLAKFENLLVQVKFTNEFLGAEAVAGDYTYTITPYTTISGYLNGNTSSPLTITKLSNAITIGVENESITLSGYQPAGTNSPTSIAYEISRYELETTTIGEGEEQQVVTNKVIKSTKSGPLTYAGDIETQITTDGSSYKLNLNDLGIFEAGNYQISLEFVGDGNAIISSEIITNDTFIKLVNSSLSTQNGVLSWSKVDSATSYTLKITCDVTGSEGEGNTTNEWLFGVTPADADNPQVNEADLKISEEQTFKFELGKTYKVQVMSNGTGILSSAWSSEFEVKKLQAPTNIAISATANKITYTDTSDPENPKTITVNVGDPMLTWSDPNGVANRLNYIYNLDGNDVLIYNTVSGSTELLGQLLPTNLAKGVYEIKMKTIGNTISGSGKIGLLTSDYSSSDSNPNANYVTESTSVGFSASGTGTIKFGTFGWTPVEGAYGYKLTFFEGMNSLKGTKVYTTYTTSNSYTFRNTEFDGSGYYTVLVNAITDPSIAIVSTYSESSSESEEEIVPVNTSSLYKAPSVSNLMVQDGMFAWGLKINDIKAFLKPHATIAGDTLLEKFEIAEEPNKESALFTKTIDYITKKINNKIEGDVIPEVDEIISTLFKFKGTINGYEQEIIPTSVKKETIGSDELLMFSLDLTVAPGVYPTNKFTLNVVPQGNYSASNDKGLISSVDGRYSGDGQTAYKPNTPTTWGVEQGAIQISEGKLLWALVTTEDFAKSGATHEQKYHYEYKITAVTNDQETKISNTINVSDTIDGGTSTNTNLSDDCYYYRYLKNDLFALSGSNAVSTNTNYNLEISVVGTKDSTLLGEGEKAYLNSNVFSYTEPMNILDNHESYVKDGEYTYIPCANMSTATKVVVYGPFTDASGEPIYAPDSTDANTWKVNNVVYADYKSALTAWKNAIQDTWNIITKTEGRTTEETELRNKLRHEYLYEEEINSSGDTITTSRQNTLNLTGQEDYLAGSYIIRKQEIGNRKGIIDTDFSETLMKADGENFEYEQIATKLDKTSKIGIHWVQNGKFEWNEVPLANAYKIYVEKVDKDDNQVKKSDNIVVYTNSYEMLEDTNFNDSNYFYRITITATHIESDGTISPNYFEGESVQTDKYGRAPIPQGLKIDENGKVSWNENVSSNAVSGYEVRINSVITTEGVGDSSYDLTQVSNGEFQFSVRSRGNVETSVAYLNSCYTEEIFITKLPTPILKIENGVFKWGTDSSGEIGQQPTTTKFKLNDGDPQILDINTGSYLLHTEITSFDSNYSATIDNQKYPSTNVFRVKYQGTSGEVTDTQKHFVVASSEQSLTATKLGYPILKNVDVQVGANTSENRIRWNAVANAQGYRAVVVTKITNSAGEKEDKIFDHSYIIGDTGNTFFVQNGDGTFDLRLTPVITELGITNTDGICLKVYVQAIGTIDSTLTSDRFLSGCFSDKEEVTIPSKAENLTFDANTGILSWGFADENAVSQGFNIKLTTQYTVTDVSQKDFDDYWKVTSDRYTDTKNSTTTTNSNPTGRASDIKNRSISYTYSTTTIDETPVNTYSIEVVDVIFLYSTIVNGYEVTPTSYQLTNIGTNYTFTVVVMVGDENNNGKYVSYPVSLTGTMEKPINFALFKFGDGTEKLPYGVNDAPSLNSIRYFLDRHFVITNDISLKDITLESDSSKNWEMIAGTFTGSIDGNNYTISGVKPNVSSDTVTMSAIMKENAGVIRNLNITMHSKNSGATSILQNVEIAGLAITNSGTIENVHIATYLIDETINSEISAIYSNTASTKVAGMTVYNSGIISNSSVEINITGLDTNYVIQGNNSVEPSLVAGIANINTGSISNTFFNGNIKGNYVGGIANVSSGTISNCYALGIAYVTDSDANTTTGDGGKNIQFGGIAGSIYGTSTIENCYSRMTISVKILSSSGDIFASIGGIVGQIENKKDSNNQDINNVVNISNCYVVFKAELTQGSFGTGNVNVLAPYKANDDENTYNYSGNFYLEESITENITVNKPTNVATDSGSVSGLASQMTALKDAENNAIYTIEIGSEIHTSKYPLLVSNPEKNPDLQSKTA